MTQEKIVKALAVEKQRFETLVEEAPIGIVLYDQDGHTRYINAKFKEMFGYGLNDIPNRREWVRQAYPDPEYRNTVIAAWNMVLKSAQPGEKKARVFTVTCKDGEDKSIRFTPVKLQSGEYLIICEDITHSKKVEDELLRIKKAVEISSNAILMTDAEGKIIYQNNACTRLLGCSAEELNAAGGTSSISIDPEAAEGIFNALASGSGWKGETELRTCDNRVIPIKLNCDTVRNENSEIAAIFAIFYDITQSRLAEQKLRAANRQLLDIIDFLPDATFAIDSGGAVIAWNKAMEEMSGVRKADMLGRGDYAYAIPIYGEARPLLADLIFKDDSETESRYEYIKRQDHTIYAEIYAPLLFNNRGAYVWCKASPLYDSEGGLTGAIESIRDITELKTVQAKLLASNRQLLDIIEFLPEATFVIDRDRKVIAWNQGMEELTGTRKEDIIGRGDYAYAEPFYGFARPILIDLVFDEKLEINDKYVLIKRDGNTIYAENFVPNAYGGRGAYLWGKIASLYDKDGSLIGAIESLHDITERKLAEDKIRQSESLRRSIVESPQNIIIFSLDQNYCYLSFNKAHSDAMKKTWGAEIENGKSVLSYITDPVEREYHRKDFERALAGESFSEFKEEILEGIGRICWEASFSPIATETGKIIGLTVFSIDITESVLTQEKLRAANRQLLDIIDFLPDATFVVDRGGTVIAWNRAMEELTGVREEDILGKAGYAYAVPFYGVPRPVLIDIIINGEPERDLGYESVKRKGDTIYGEVVTQLTVNKTRVYLWCKASPLYDSDGNITGAIESIRDITENKQAEEKLKYLSLHDHLTGLHNRTYFEEKMHKAAGGRFDPLGIIVCDLDGLKFVNDTLGHDAGDSILVATASIISNAFSPDNIVARIGGDEFAVLLPNSSEKTVEEACGRIKEAVEKYNLDGPRIPLNISMGFAVGCVQETGVSEVFKSADNNMYREKLHRSHSARSAIVQTLLKALEARDFITEGHAVRLEEYVNKLARAIGMPMRNVSDLSLLAKFHDIGKVGVRDSILFKPGALTAEEAAEMQRHSEIGHRIAQSAPDLEPIADWILKHHEWWNGSGYPLGLKGEEIPLECRILAIADAYDAMTNDRPYRKALPREIAVGELKKFAGVQFDPGLVDYFLNMLGNDYHK